MPHDSLRGRPMYPTNFRFTPGRILLLIAAALVLPSTVNASGTFRTVFEFNSVGGGTPYAGLTLDSAGNLYGTTADGGTSSRGTVFKLTRNLDGTWTESTLHSFQGGSDGSFPNAEVVFDSAGNLYGTTNNGGGCQSYTFGCGTVYKLTPQADGTWTETILYKFTGGADGSGPYNSGALLDAAGNFYGTTVEGGKGYGVVFKLTPNPDGSWSEHVLHTFAGGFDGAKPLGGVVSDSAGNLYGETSLGGGHNNCGSVFKLGLNSNGSWSKTVLHSFCSSSSDGNVPLGGLAFDSAGNLYGVTFYGGSGGDGTVFRLKHDSDGSWSYRKIHTFLGTPARAPAAGLTIDAAGIIYGTTKLGGSANKGVIFKLTHNPDGSWTLKVLHNFLGKPAA